MGQVLCCARPVRQAEQQEKPPDDEEVASGWEAAAAAAAAEDAAGSGRVSQSRISAFSTSSRHPLEALSSIGPPGTAFRHTSDLRVGVIEGKQASVTLLNDYIVLGSLGKGAYGSVKLCYSMLDDSLYALKVLQRAQLKRQMLGPRPRQGGGQDATLDMFRREVDVMRSMNHPNLIKIFEVIEHTSKVVFVMEYAEAGPVAQPDQLMSEGLAQYYFRQIVAGLSALHSQNVVHGDMKPDNVLLSGSGLVKIADFGQAHFFEAGTDVFSKTLGTPAFMAPEMRSGEQYHGMPADMWALGVTLYSFLFGDVPFKGNTLDELYTAIQTEEHLYPANVPISPELRSVLDGLLSKDPAKRPTALQLLHHPWVAEEDERWKGLEVPQLELERMDDAPSLENWVQELALQPPEEASPMPLVNEVAVSVFGRDLLEGSGPLSTQAIMEAITEATTKASSLDGLSPSSQLLPASPRRSASLPLPGQPSASSSVSGLVELAQLQEEAGIASTSRAASPRQRPAAAAELAGRASTATAAAAAPAAAAAATVAAAPAASPFAAPAAAPATSPFAAPAAAPAQQAASAAANGTAASGTAAEQPAVPATVVPQSQYVDDFPSFLRQLEADQGLQPLPAAAETEAGPSGAAAAEAREASGRGRMEADSFGPAGSAQIAEQVAAALNQLLTDIGDGLEKVGQRIGKRAGKAADRVGTARKALSPLRLEAARRAASSSAAQPSEQQQQQGSPQSSPQAFAAFQQPPGSFTAGAAAAAPLAADGQQQQEAQEAQEQGGERPHVQRRRHEPVAAEQQQSLPTPHHLLAMHSTAHGTLPCSPFESMGGPPAEQPSIASTLIRGISQAPAQGSLEAPAGEAVHAPGGFSEKQRQRLGGGRVGPLGPTEAVWEEMKMKTAKNQVPGVRFVTFPAGLIFDFPDTSQGNFCLLVEKGIVDLRYVARLDLPLPHAEDGGDAGSSSSADGGSSSSESDSEDEARLQRRDTLARGPEARAINRNRRKLQPSDSLRGTVDRVLQRAEAILGSATTPGEANLLSTQRGPNDFVGITPMLDPARYAKLSARWVRHMSCRTEVTGALLTRQAVELLLRHYPLAQVYLRITLSKSRAEVLQLEALENIAACMAPKERRTPSGRQPGGRTASRLRLDLFRAVSFARKLAESLAEQTLGKA